MGRRRAGNKGLIRGNDRNGQVAQACRQIFQRLCQEMKDVQHRCCAITSASPREGRSSLAINLGTIAARETGSPVLLIDSDTEAPSLHRALGLSTGPGLSDVVAGRAVFSEAVRSVGSDDGLKVLTCGEKPIGAVTLAESSAVSKLLDEARAQFAWVFADTAPLLISFSAATFAAQSDGVLLAVRSGGTRAQLVSQAVEQLDAAQTKTLGVVLTQRHYVIPSFVYRRL